MLDHTIYGNPHMNKHSLRLRPATGAAAAALPLLPSLAAVAVVGTGSGVCGLRPLSAPQAWLGWDPWKSIILCTYVLYMYKYVNIYIYIYIHTYIHIYICI